MRESRKIKLKKLDFYIIDDKYIKYLSQFDKHIAYNKNETRPYIGVIIVVENYYYFAPLFSPKQKHKTYRDNLSFFRIINLKTKKELGIIRFTDMIPVPQESVSKLDMKDKSYGYKRLLSEQYNYINLTKNRKAIIQKANKIYQVVTKNGKKNKMIMFYKNLSCDFKILEEKCKNYKG